MAWENGVFKFECVACNSSSERSRKASFCIDCAEARAKFFAMIRQPYYPVKPCKGCGTAMLNCEYGGKQFCEECTLVRERRHNGWKDPYARTNRAYVAANDNAPQTKVCRSCECELPISDFDKHKKDALGVAADCRDCRAAWRAHEGREAEYARRNTQRTGDPDWSRAAKKKKLMAICDRRRGSDVKARREIGRRIDVYLNRFYKPWLKPGISEAQKYTLRYANDNEFVLRERTRRRLRRKGFGFDALWRMRQALNGDVGEVATATVEAALGYTMTDLRIHLEALFTEGMSWEVFRKGEIHIDHKKPLSRFNLDDPEQAAEAWSLENLQPLWAVDNMKKGAKTDEEWRAAA